MENLNRRDVLVALSAFAAMGGVEARAQASARPGEKMLSESMAFPFDSLEVRKNQNGVSRPVVQGVLATGETVEMHETTLLPGHMPHPPHKHRHSEFMMIREGQLEFDNDGKKERVGPGGVIFAASNVMHALLNVGETPANYFVIAIGRESGITPVGAK
ncbi:cupin domain-containing protein [Edaphobacter bradus]|uniref:cupin domain-containing protein n=1 Tax=Edaphobacter bradus TaxID=2259016 RepID=UPI0021E0AF39|nr:cupin domain-containing protein [Edaphobacter bradus]